MTAGVAHGIGEPPPLNQVRQGQNIVGFYLPQLALPDGRCHIGPARAIVIRCLQIMPDTRDTRPGSDRASSLRLRRLNNYQTVDLQLWNEKCDPVSVFLKFEFYLAAVVGRK